MRETATADDIRWFQLFLIETGASIVNRNRIMTGVRFLFRITLRRHDLAAEIYHLKEPQKLPAVVGPVSRRLPRRRTVIFPGYKIAGTLDRRGRRHV